MIIKYYIFYLDRKISAPVGTHGYRPIDMYFATEIYNLDNVSIIFLPYFFKIILFCSKNMCLEHCTDFTYINCRGAAGRAAAS
jgi:hypothetical protein